MIETTIIEVKGLRREHRFLHISDCHVYEESPLNTPEENELIRELTEKKTWMPGEETTGEALRETLREGMELSPEAILLTGDGIDFVSPGNLETLRGILSETGTELLYVFGNHENGHYFKKLTRDACYPLYKGLMPDTPDFWVRDYGDLLVAGLDDSGHDVTKKQVAALRETLDRGIPVLLAIHAPLEEPELERKTVEVWGKDGPGYFLVGENPERDRDKTGEFYRLAAREKTALCAVAAGHVHFPYCGTLPNGVRQYVADGSFMEYARLLILKPAGRG